MMPNHQSQQLRELVYYHLILLFLDFQLARPESQSGRYYRHYRQYLLLYLLKSMNRGHLKDNEQIIPNYII